MGSDGTRAEARFDPRFSVRFQRGVLPGAAEREPVSVGRREDEREAREAAFAADPLDAPAHASSEAPDTPTSAAAPVDERRALAFVRGCAIGCLALVALLVAAAVAAQTSVTSLSGHEWVYFLSQFAFIAAPSLFVLGIAAFIFVGYRRRLHPTPPPPERTPR